MTEENKTKSSMTQVKTIYARIAMGLLGLNFLLTGYAVTQLNNTVQSQIHSQNKNGFSQPSRLSREREKQNPTETRER